MDRNILHCAAIMAALVLCIVLGAAALANDVAGSDIVLLSMLNQNPTPAMAGDTVELRVGVENQGGEAVKDLVLEFIPSYPFESLDGYPIKLSMGDLNAYQGGDNMKVAKFTVRVNKDVTADTYMLKIKRYQAASPDKAVVFNYPVQVKGRESAEVIFIDKTTLLPGEVSPMKFTINNVGSAPLRDLVFSWSNKEGVVLPVGGDNTQHVKYLDQGESVDLTYNVVADPNADTGLYALALNLQYLDTINGSVKTIATIAGVYVGGGTDFDVAFAQSSAGQTSFTVANIGSNTAYSVSVILPEQKGWTVSGSNDVIIGNLNKGDYTIATYSLRSAGAATGTNGARYSRTSQATAQPTTGQSNATSDTITLRIQYTDTRGVRQSVDKTIKLLPSDVTSAQPTTTAVKTTSVWSTYGWYIAVAVMIVLAFLGWRWWRKRSAARLAAPEKKKR